MDYIRQSVESGKIAGGGQFTRACEQLLSDSLDGTPSLLTNSGTDALEMAALLLDLEPGDEVIMPSYTFSSTANAFCLRGARPVFVDIRTDTLNLDEALLEDAITARTRAVVPVHYAGVSCEMDAISAVARKHDIAVVEDAAQAIFCRYRGRPLGAIGDLGCLSFHETKTVICGEGGALTIARPDLLERAEILREKGTNRTAFFRGDVDKYTWVDIGSSFLPSDVVAAFLYAQLEQEAAIVDARQTIFRNYEQLLAPLAADGLVTLPTVPDHCDISYHMFYLLAEDTATRDGIIRTLRDNGIFAVFHYVPLHSSPMGRQVSEPVNLPVTDSVAGRIVRLPLYNSLGVSEQEAIADHIFSFFGRSRPG